MLCYEHIRMGVTCDIGTCTSCGDYTSSGSFDLCEKCATEQNKCAHSGCTIPLDAVKPPAAPDQRLFYILTIDKKYYLLVAPPAEGRGQLFEQRTAIVATFKEELAAWLRERNLESAVEITSTLEALALLYIMCTASTAEALKSMPGVEYLIPGD